MTRYPLVSILIPTYNRADYLPLALDSALNQTYPNLEIIVHDDASTDNTPQVFSAYRGKPRLKLIRTETNHGMIGGWNYLQKKAKGEYIKFLASDDTLVPTCVAELIRAAQRVPKPALITSRRLTIDSAGRPLSTLGFANKDQVQSGLTHAKKILRSVRENKIGEPTAVLYPRDLIALAGEYDPTFSQFADFEYWIRLLGHGSLVYVNQTLCSFRTHPGSNTSAAIADGRFITEIFALIHKYYDSPIYRQTFGLTEADRTLVTRRKTLDTLKNIKDLFVAGKLAQASRYFRRLKREVELDFMTTETLKFLLSR